MSKQIINNGESGLSARTKLNQNFTELYDSSSSLNVFQSSVQLLSSNWQTTYIASSSYISSIPTGTPEANALTNIIRITQNGYNNIINPSLDTLYIIVG